MSDRSGMSKIIRGDAQTVYERYELPNVKTLHQQEKDRAGRVTAQQLEELHKQAYEEGFQQGKDEGYQAGLEQGKTEGHKQGLLEGQEEVQQIIRRFEQILKFLTEPVEDINLEVEEELLALAMATAKQIIRREINADPGQIIAVIKEGIAALPSGANKIKVYLHPADAEIARENLKLSAQKNAESDNIEEQMWSVLEEPVLTRGGCRIETEFSQIDATIETRVAEIAAQIMGSERGAARQEDVEPVSEEVEAESSSLKEENDAK